MIQMNNMIKRDSQSNQSESQVKSQSTVRVVKRHSFKSSLLGGIGIILLLWAILNIFSSWFAWKAVFLDNNQVFFGKFINIPFTSKIVLRQTHYIKTDTIGDESQAAVASTDAIIAPLQDMVHGPRSTRIINKDHVLYYEVLRTDTTLVKGLNDSLKQ
jgi:hypothetical protein